MKVLTYLGFTLLSILMQFCMMDFIHEKMSQKEKVTDLNTSQKEVSNILKNLSSEPHALYYQKHLVKPARLLQGSQPYNNSSIIDGFIETTTDLLSSVIDVLYDENASVTELTSTETMTTTEYDNFTEITLFEKNQTSIKPKELPKKNISHLNNNCYCNFLFKVCDINCCCDTDCEENEKKLFNCTKDITHVNFNEELCILRHPFKLDHSNTIDFLDNLFCVAKTNLPEKRNIPYFKSDTTFINQIYKWKPNVKAENTKEFNKKVFQTNDPVWLLKNGSIIYLDIPTNYITGYCLARKPLQFLHNAKVTCNVKFGDLEMFRAHSVAMETKVISLTNNTLNSTYMNCSSLICTNWTVITCIEDTCVNYNKTLHEPLCSEKQCTNIATRIDYIFYYHHGQFVNASMIFYLSTVSPSAQLLAQTVNVQFILANQSLDNIVALSGNPGYIRGLPIVASYQKLNRTQIFFNSTNKLHHMPMIGNQHGSCVKSNTSKDFILFGVNKRRKCKFTYSNVKKTQNSTDICIAIQNSIDTMFSINHSAVVAPLGNPYGLKDESWIPIVKYFLNDSESIHGQYQRSNSTLKCFNLMTQLSYIFIFRDSSDEENKRENNIFSVFRKEAVQNVTLDIDDLSVILTMDTTFVDSTKPLISEFAGSPHLRIHLPKDFFFPFPLNHSIFIKISNILLIVCTLALCLTVH